MDKSKISNIGQDPGIELTGCTCKQLVDKLERGYSYTNTSRSVHLDETSRFFRDRLENNISRTGNDITRRPVDPVSIRLRRKKKYEMHGEMQGENGNCLECVCIRWGEVLGVADARKETTTMPAGERHFWQASLRNKVSKALTNGCKATSHYLPHRDKQSPG
ncbi:hypothetical protein KM043_015463 [Ampulex compressa]|nr:hypothetical protein KM043_015463 [Ampulex compressa]